MFNSSSRGCSSRHQTADSAPTPGGWSPLALRSPNDTWYTGLPWQEGQYRTVCVSLFWILLPVSFCLWPLPIYKCHRDVAVGMLVTYWGKRQGAGGRYIVFIASIIVFLAHLWMICVMKGGAQVWMSSGKSSGGGSSHGNCGDCLQFPKGPLLTDI